MRTIKTLLIAIVALLAFTMVFLLREESPTGMVVTSFSASVMIYDPIIQSNATQLGVPITSGSSVQFTVLLTYNGTGLANVTIPMPDGFQNGYNWTIHEPGRIVAVTAVGQTLAWEANSSAQTANLSFLVVAPYEAIVSENPEDTSYTLTVVVGAENHFTNVSALVPIDTSYRDFQLFENGTDVTIAYHFNVTDGMARWSGFNLSTKTFVVTGVKDASAESASGRRKSPPDVTGAASILADNEFSITPLLVQVTVQEGLWTTTYVTITNSGNRTHTFSLRTTSDLLSVDDRLMLAPGEEKTLPVRVLGGVVGMQESRLQVSDGRRLRETLVRITSVPAPTYAVPLTEKPAVVTKTENVSVQQFDWKIFSLIAAGIALLLIVLFHPRMTRDQNS